MDAERRSALKRRIEAAFPSGPEPPPMSLRGGDAIDGYDVAPAFDPDLDAPSADYLERHPCGIHHLDPDSWLHYLPVLLGHCLDEMESGTSTAVDTFLFSLRPPDRDPPRFARLSAGQRAVVVEVLEALGFSPSSRYQDDALTALQEYWHED